MSTDKNTYLPKTNPEQWVEGIPGGNNFVYLQCLWRVTIALFRETGLNRTRKAQNGGILTQERTLWFNWSIVLRIKAMSVWEPPLFLPRPWANRPDHKICSIKCIKVYWVSVLVWFVLFTKLPKFFSFLVSNLSELKLWNFSPTKGY